jgi:hypothetical protein
MAPRPTKQTNINSLTTNDIGGSLGRCPTALTIVGGMANNAAAIPKIRRPSSWDLDRIHPCDGSRRESRVMTLKATARQGWMRRVMRNLRPILERIAENVEFPTRNFASYDNRVHEYEDVRSAAGRMCAPGSGAVS